MNIESIKLIFSTLVKSLPYVIAIVIYIASCLYCFNLGLQKANKVITNNITQPTKVQTETKTVIQYVPKDVDSDGNVENTDIDANVGKQDIVVSLNGEKQVIHKDDFEKYVFDKNKLALEQTSKATVDLKIPVVDNTKKWSIGVGYSNNGVSGKVDFPIKKNIGGWVYADRESKAVGVSVKF